MTEPERFGSLAQIGKLTKEALTLADGLARRSGMDEFDANDRLRLHDVGIGLEAALTHVEALLAKHRSAASDAAKGGSAGSQVGAQC